MSVIVTNIFHFVCDKYFPLCLNAFIQYGDLFYIWSIFNGWQSLFSLNITVRVQRCFSNLLPGAYVPFSANWSTWAPRSIILLLCCTNLINMATVRTRFAKKYMYCYLATEYFVSGVENVEPHFGCQLKIKIALLTHDTRRLILYCD